MASLVVGASQCRHLSDHLGVPVQFQSGTKVQDIVQAFDLHEVVLFLTNISLFLYSYWYLM
jgi:hypothetical protein